jgi:hypothetical protein
MVAVAVVLSLAVPQLAANRADLLVALAFTLMASVWAVVLTIRGLTFGALVNVVPAVDFLALGVLRWATGSSASVFTALAVLPVVWIAAQVGRRYVVYAALGTAVVILTPFLFGNSGTHVAGEFIRLGVVLVSYTTLAAVVNHLSQRYSLELAVSRDREANIEAEIQRAADVQRSLLPQRLRPGLGYVVAGCAFRRDPSEGIFLTGTKPATGSRSPSAT